MLDQVQVACAKVLVHDAVHDAVDGRVAEGQPDGDRPEDAGHRLPDAAGAQHDDCGQPEEDEENHDGDERHQQAMFLLLLKTVFLSFNAKGCQKSQTFWV